MEIINKTPHPVSLMEADRIIHTWPADTGEPIRLEQAVARTGHVLIITEGSEDICVPLSHSVFGNAVLPEENPGIFYIVSRMIKSAYPAREDFLVPAEIVRDAAGNIIGCRSMEL